MDTSTPTPRIQGWIVRALRLAKGWTQEELAIAAGIDQSMVSKIEREQATDVRLATAGRLASALDSTVGVLIGEVPFVSERTNLSNAA